MYQFFILCRFCEIYTAFASVTLQKDNYTIYNIYITNFASLLQLRYHFPLARTLTVLRRGFVSVKILDINS